MTTAQDVRASTYRVLATLIERPVLRYVIAFLIFVAALALRLVIFPLEAGYAFFTFYPAVVMAALLCGTGPAVMGIALSSIVVDYILISPAWTWSLTYPALASILVYIVSSVLICVMIQANREGEVERALLAAVVRSADVAVISETLQGTITSWNPEAERLFGYSSAEAIGKSKGMLFPADRMDEEAAMIARISRGEIVTAYETVRIRKDGSALDVSVTLSPVWDRFGRIAGASKILHDITQHKALEEGLKRSNLQLNATVAELKRSNQELDEFAFIASHDLKEPLRGIHNYVSFLLEDYSASLPDEARNYLDRIQRLAERMTALIDCLLNLSRLGRTPLPLETVNLDAVLDEVADDVNASLAALHVELRRAGPLPVVTGNALRLREVFQNLIANAAKYNDKPTKWIEVGCDKKGEVPIFYVRDNGIGIQPQHQDLVFRIFKRLHEQSKYGGGTGAGLTIAKKIVEYHGGRIWLESVVGEGTTFYFTLARSRL